MAPRLRKTVAAPSNPPQPVADYRIDAARKNILPAGLAAQGKLAEPKRIRYDYDPHRPPLLRFDASGAADRVPELLETTRQRALTDKEARLLAEALRNRQPWLEWAGKREQQSFAVEPVALHIHERIGPCVPTLRSHINQVVADTDSWEQAAAFRLEQACDLVAFYTCNDHLELSIPYEYLGGVHAYFPDFVVRLTNGVTLLLEIKGEEREQDRAKHQAARRWVSAVNSGANSDGGRSTPARTRSG